MCVVGVLIATVGGVKLIILPFFLFGGEAKIRDPRFWRPHFSASATERGSTDIARAI